MKATMRGFYLRKDSSYCLLIEHVWTFRIVLTESFSTKTPLESWDSVILPSVQSSPWCWSSLHRKLLTSYTILPPWCAMIAHRLRWSCTTYPPVQIKPSVSMGFSLMNELLKFPSTEIKFCSLQLLSSVTMTGKISLKPEGTAVNAAPWLMLVIRQIWWTSPSVRPIQDFPSSPYLPFFNELSL